MPMHRVPMFSDIATGAGMSTQGFLPLERLSKFGRLREDDRAGRAIRGP